MKTYKTFLTEADTSAATNAEMAIVYAYNKWDYNGKVVNTDEGALDLGGITSEKWDKFKKAKNFNAQIATGKAVAMKLDAGNHLVHAGSATAPTKYPKPASDNTSKSDLYGTIKGSNFSLKKKGDTSSGAQLMSAKSGEAAGVFKFAKMHLEANNSSVSKKGYKDALSILKVDMEATATNEMYVYVGEGKKDFQLFWKSKKNPRFAKLKTALSGFQVDRQGYIKGKKDKAPKLKKIDLSDGSTKKKGSDISNHLDAELSLLGARSTTMSKPEKYLLKSLNSKHGNESFIAPPTKTELKAAQDVFKASTSIVISTTGKNPTRISADHLKKVPEENLSNKALKKQIIGVIDVAIKAKGWKEELTKFFDKNEDFKKWVIYEAASGEGKFSGMAAGTSSYSGGVSSVANTMLVFSNKGKESQDDIYKWAGNHTNLMDSLSISYKGSGSSRYIKMGIATGVEYDNPSMITEEVSNTLENIIDVELVNYRGAMYQLNEGFLDSVKGLYKSVKDTAKLIAQKAQDILKKFYMAVIKKFMDKVFEWAEKGIDFLLEILGFEMVGDVSIATPSW